MPPRKRKEPTEDDEDNATQSSQSSQSLAAAASPLSPEETEKLANELCRYVLMREHTKKPISRAEAKKAVLKERSDSGGKIMKALLVHANEKLLALCGLELVAEGGATNGTGEEEADASQGASQSSQGASQSQGGSQGQGSSQGGRQTGGGRYILANRLEEAGRLVRSTPSKQAAEYHSLVMVVLELLAHGEGTMEESTLLDHWLSAKLRAPKDTKLPNQRQTVGDLVTKTMVQEAFLKRSKNASTGKTEYSAGPRATLTRDMVASDAFVKSL